jgi:hypothetical protein
VGKVIYKHKPEMSVGIAEIATWLANSLFIGDTIDRAILQSTGKFDRKLRRNGKAKVTKLRVSALLNRGENSYIYLTDGEFTYTFKILPDKQNAFLVEFSPSGIEDNLQWC